MLSTGNSTRGQLGIQGTLNVFVPLWLGVLPLTVNVMGLVLLHGSLDLQLLGLLGDLCLLQLLSLLLFDLFLAIPLCPLLFLCSFSLSFGPVYFRFNLLSSSNALAYSYTYFFANPSPLLSSAGFCCGYTSEGLSCIGSFDRNDPPRKLASRL